MAVAIVLEDGSGVVGANAYDDVATVATRLSDLGYGFFAAASPDNQAAYLVRGTASVDRSLKSAAAGSPREYSQGLYYPRAYFYTTEGYVDTYVIPETVRLVSSLKAEFLARRDAPTNELSGIPAGVTEVEFADGVRVRKAVGVLRDAALDDLHAEIVGHVDLLLSRPVVGASAIWGA